MNMVRATVAALAVTLVGCAHASSPQPPRSALTACEKVSDLAESVMEARQGGMAMSVAMRAVSASGTMGREMVMQAYEWPIGHTAYNRRYAVGLFRDSWYSSCIEILMPTHF